MSFAYVVQSGQPYTCPRLLPNTRTKSRVTNDPHWLHSCMAYRVNCQHASRAGMGSACLSNPFNTTLGAVGQIRPRSGVPQGLPGQFTALCDPWLLGATRRPIGSLQLLERRLVCREGNPEFALVVVGRRPHNLDALEQGRQRRLRLGFGAVADGHT